MLNATDLGSFQLLAGSDGHGPVHIQLGGMWGGCSKAYAEFEEKWADVLDAAMTTEEMELTGNKDTRRVMVEKSVMGEYFRIYQ